MAPTRAFDDFNPLTRRTRIGRVDKTLFSNVPYPFGKRLASNVALVGMDTTRNDILDPRLWATGELQEEMSKQQRGFFTSTTTPFIELL